MVLRRPHGDRVGDKGPEGELTVASFESLSASGLLNFKAADTCLQVGEPSRDRRRCRASRATSLDAP